MDSTNGREGKGRARARKPSERDRRLAAELVESADALVNEVLAPGRWPQARTVDRFLKDDRLERVLSLYARAMRLDPGEPAYPWNLSSTLNRLGLNDLALGFMTRALHVAEEVGDEEWSDADAHLALAEIALDAGETDIALMAIARARQLAPTGADVDAHARRLLAAVRKASKDPRPEVSLAVRLLDRMPA